MKFGELKLGQKFKFASPERQAEGECTIKEMCFCGCNRPAFYQDSLNREFLVGIGKSIQDIEVEAVNGQAHNLL